MKRLFVLLAFLFLSLNAWGYSRSENKALNVPRTMEKDMNLLVSHLVANEPDKLEQAKTIAVWIASHIAYDNYTYAAGVGKASGHTASSLLKRGDQDADSVFKNRIGTCTGYVNLYEKMLSLAGIRSQKIHGFVLEKVATVTQAKMKIRQEKIGHVWTQVLGVGNPNILVDVTWMSRGQSGNTNQRLTNQMRRQEIQKLQQESHQHPYDIQYFNFEYKNLHSQGEYRFSEDKKLLQK